MQVTFGSSGRLRSSQPLLQPGSEEERRGGGEDVTTGPFARVSSIQADTFRPRSSSSNIAAPPYARQANTLSQKKNVGKLGLKAGAANHSSSRPSNCCSHSFDSCSRFLAAHSPASKMRDESRDCRKPKAVRIQSANLWLNHFGFADRRRNDHSPFVPAL